VAAIYPRFQLERPEQVDQALRDLIAEAYR